MGSRIKSWLFGRSNNTTTGTPYDSAVALDPPVRGSYPVAGNGPNVLKKIQHARATTISHERGRTTSFREVERPKTAPNGRRPASYTLPAADGERTRSGFSMKAPPNLSNSIAHDPTEPVPPLPTPARPKRLVRVYQPTRPATSATSSITSSASHIRSESADSRRTFVDILDAHSKIRPSRDVSRHRIQASGVRDHGEDVADRNISLFGEQGKEIPPRNSRRLDINSPDLSYLKSIYSSRKAALIAEGPDSRAASALGHILGDASASDDITKPRSMHPNPGPTASRAPVAESSNTEPAVSHKTKQKNDDGPTLENTERAFPLLSTAQASGKHRSLPYPTRTPSTSRGRARTLKEPPPVPPPSEFPRVTYHGDTNTSETKQQRRHTMSSATQSNVAAAAKSNRPSPAKPSEAHTTPRPFPLKSNKMIVEGAKEPPSLKGILDLTNSVDADVKTKTLPAVTHENLTRERREIVQESITREIHYHDVYHRILPVIDTEILPTKHYLKQEDGSLVEMPESDMLSHEPTWNIKPVGPPSNPRISEDSEPGAEAPVISFTRNSHRKPTSHLRSHASSATLSPHASAYDDDSADCPVVPLARGEGQRRPSTAVSAKRSLEPILTSKKQYTTEEGYPRTEYVWYHPPLFEDMHGRTQPATIATGLPDLTSLSSSAYGNPRYSSDDDMSEYDAPRAAKGEEELLFRDSGYGSGMLPGLHEKSPMANFTPRMAAPGSGVNEIWGRNGSVNPESGPIKLGRVVEQDGWDDSSSTEGEATKFLQRLRELRRSSAISKDHDKAARMNDLQKGVNGLNIKN